MENRQLPRPGTISRKVLDELAAAPHGLRYTDMIDVWHDEQKKRYNSPCRWSRDYISMNLNRLLKRFAHKTGPTGTHAPWKLGPKPPEPHPFDLSKLPPIDVVMGVEKPDGRAAQMALHGPAIVTISEPYESQRTRDLRRALEESIASDRQLHKLKTLLASLTKDERLDALHLLQEEFPMEDDS